LIYKHLPNIISVLRIALVVPVVMSLLEGRFTLALILFGVAGVSDGLDGFYAKRYNCVTRLGTILDPLADKILLISCYVTLFWLGLLPDWLVVSVILRDVIIVLGAGVVRYVIGPFEIIPRVLSKLNTFAQIVLVMAVVLSNGLLPLSDWMLEVLVYSVLFTTVISGLDYMLRWGGLVIFRKSD